MSTDAEVRRLADAVEQHNALKRLELVLELQEQPEYPDSYPSLVDTVRDMERDNR